MSSKIFGLMKTPLANRDVGWLQGALQSAIELELSTLPPYLCGLWSLEDQQSDAAGLIESVTLDEMSHLGLACNLLRATGQQPKIFTGYDEISYPGQLPGVRPKCDPKFFPCDPNFQVVLGFNAFRDFARMAMQIEYPEDPVPRPALVKTAETFPSIGEFYDAVIEAFMDNDGKFRYQTDRQLTNRSPQVFVVDGLANATLAITTIQKQGEGTSRFPFADPQGTQLAHFYLFGELYFGKKFVFNSNTQTGDWTGEAISIPPAFPMTPVPPGGYGNNAPPEVGDCDAAFTTLLQQLDDAWANGDQSTLRDAVGTMTDLEGKATQLLEKQIARPDGGIYGPQFRKR